MSAVQSPLLPQSPPLIGAPESEVHGPPPVMALGEGHVYSAFTSLKQAIASSLNFDDLFAILSPEKIQRISTYILSQLDEISCQLQKFGKAKCELALGKGEEAVCKFRNMSGENLSSHPLYGSSPNSSISTPHLQPKEKEDYPLILSYLRIHACTESTKSVEILDYLTGPSQGLFMYARPKGDSTDEKYKLREDSLIHEWRISQKLTNSPYVLKLDAVVRWKDRSMFKALIAPWGTFGDLGAYIDEKKYCPVPSSQSPDQQKQRIFWQMTTGLGYINSRGFVHRDIKPKNIVLKATPTGIVAQILDFGRTVVKGKRVERPVGAREYTPPEAWALNKIIDPTYDTWSLGITGVELFFTRAGNPYLWPQQRKNRDSDYFDPNRYPFLQEEWKRLHDVLISRLPRNHPMTSHIESCINLDPLQRPLAETLAERLKQLYPNECSGE